ncbi:hemagluttinin repeat protein [Lasius niger]|uniref:Hemagluttinin repeat protein n=1 Tax=Lasius niger TaxID=67767 RepID=A0A0J7KFX6_LASNI|nr:hemagluttinin repeat protein [Lasius niger]
MCVDKHDGGQEQRKSATANDAVELPAVDNGKRVQEEAAPVSLTEKSGGQVRTGKTPVSPVASTSEVQGLGRAKKEEKPKRYRSVSKEIGKGPEGEILFRNVLEALGDSEESGDEASRVL